MTFRWMIAGTAALALEYMKYPPPLTPTITMAATVNNPRRPGKTRC